MQCSWGKKEKRTLLLDIKPLAGTTPLRDRLGEHGHEVLVVVLGPPRELAQVEGRRELHGGLLRVADDLATFMLAPLFDSGHAAPPPAGQSKYERGRRSTEGWD